jgi:hypothetical protein
VKNQKPIIFLLLLSGALVAAGESLSLRNPGTMDACYSFVEGKMVAQGHGWVEPFIWNYLDDPQALPHPAFLYWMPLPAILASIGLFLAGDGFRQAQIGFWLLAATFPAFVYWLARRWNSSFSVSLVAALLAMFPGFYAVYAGTTDGFYIYAWVGGGILALIGELHAASPIKIVVLGILCGFAHLTRADGILLIGLSAVWWIRLAEPSRGRKILGIGLLLIGYVLASGVWYLRNGMEYDSLWLPFSQRALWIQNYDQLFHFPARDLTLPWLLAGGIPAMIAARWEAFLLNLQTTLFVLGLIVFCPFMVLGLFSLRRNDAVRFGAVYYALLFLVMTLVFPFQGSRGGLFHSSSAVLSLACLSAACGMDRAIRWLAERRQWNLHEAMPILMGGMVVIAAVTTAAIFRGRMDGGDLGTGAGGNKQVIYRQLASATASDDSILAPVMVGDPACYFAETNQPALAIPEGGITSVLAVADRFHARYILLDRDIPSELLPLYLTQETESRLIPITTFSDGKSMVPYILYKIISNSEQSHVG